MAMTDCVIFTAGRLYVACAECGAADSQPHVTGEGSDLKVYCATHCPVHSPAPFVFAGEMQSGVVSGEQGGLFE